MIYKINIKLIFKIDKIITILTYGLSPRHVSHKIGNSFIKKYIYIIKVNLY